MLKSIRGNRRLKIETIKIVRRTDRSGLNYDRQTFCVVNCDLFFVIERNGERYRNRIIPVVFSTF